MTGQPAVYWSSQNVQLACDARALELLRRPRLAARDREFAEHALAELCAELDRR